MLVIQGTQQQQQQQEEEEEEKKEEEEETEQAVLQQGLEQTRSCLCQRLWRRAQWCSAEWHATPVSMGGCSDCSQADVLQGSTHHHAYATNHHATTAESLFALSLVVCGIGALTWCCTR
jgi:hypothetical protein